VSNSTSFFSNAIWGHHHGNENIIAKAGKAANGRVKFASEPFFLLLLNACVSSTAMSSAF
jgi:hypothetical protein